MIIIKNVKCSRNESDIEWLRRNGEGDCPWNAMGGKVSTKDSDDDRV